MAIINFKSRKTWVITGIAVILLMGVLNRYIHRNDEPPPVEQTTTPVNVGDNCFDANGVQVPCSDMTQIDQLPPPPTVRSYDGAVVPVLDYLNDNLNNPASYVGVEWSKMVTDNANALCFYKVRHKYRASNGFGGIVTNNQVFCMDKHGKVVSVYTYNR